MLTKEAIFRMLSEDGKAFNEPFLWFGKHPETGEVAIEKNQSEYNAYVRHLNSIGISYEEELNLENDISQEIKSIIAVVFKVGPESQLSGKRNEFADFFNIEYDEKAEFIIIKIHYNQPD